MSFWHCLLLGKCRFTSVIDTYVCQDLNVVLTAPEIAVNLLTWSLGFPLMKCEMSTLVLCSRRSLDVRFVFFPTGC